MNIQLAITQDDNTIIDRGEYNITGKQEILQDYLDYFELENMQDLLIKILRKINRTMKNVYIEEEIIKLEESDDYNLGDSV